MNTISAKQVEEFELYCTNYVHNVEAKAVITSESEVREQE